LSLELLIEIGCEEIPARFIVGATQRLSQLIVDGLSEQRLSTSDVKSYCTPRRLVVFMEKISKNQPDQTEIITGPPVSAAYDQQNNPTKAAEGFARKHSLTVADLKRIKTEKGEYLGIEKITPGRSAHAILTELIPTVLKKMDFPKNMTWESSGFSFVRPIRWMMILLDGKILPLQIADIRTSNFTFGHRILSNDSKIEVYNYQDYKTKMLNHMVIYDPDQRKRRITADLSILAEKNQGHLIPDEKLLETVIYLNEYPSVICGKFDPEFLDVPCEVLITVMREHQKYFSLQDDSGKLIPKFLAVVDSMPEHHGLIVAGHERVLKARLADARFFWNFDNQHPLTERKESLKGIVFQAKLGSMYDKSLRIAKLSQMLARLLKKNDLIPILKEAACICKTDLTTDMVREFSDLQGVMGGLYSKKQKLPEAVSEAIYDHYRPLSLEDESPRTIAGAILSVADKMDSVMGAFSIGQVPTGSRDPLAIRRQTLGIIKVILDYGMNISLKKMGYRGYINYKKVAQLSWDDTWKLFEIFVKERIRFVFKEKGFNYDEINSVLEAGVDDPLDCLNRLNALAEMRGSDNFYSLATSFKRIKNIVIKAGLTAESEFPVSLELFQESEERDLYSSISRISPLVNRLRKKSDFKKIFALLASLRPQIDRFFEKVLVMAVDPRIQQNRLSLLGSLWKLFLGVADISEIVVS